MKKKFYISFNEIKWAVIRSNRLVLKGNYLRCVRFIFQLEVFRAKKTMYRRWAEVVETNLLVYRNNDFLKYARGITSEI
jgi:hypothetical protein